MERIRKGKPDGAQRAAPSIWILWRYACSVDEQLVSRGGTGPSSALGWPGQEGWGSGKLQGGRRPVQLLGVLMMDRFLFSQSHST